MFYSIGQIAKKMGISVSALRYYDKEGLLPFVERTKGGARLFSEKDFNTLAVIHCLKMTGMEIKDIRRYIEMAEKGDDTIDERLELFNTQREKVEAQIKDLKEMLGMIEYKCWFYEMAKADGTADRVLNMPLSEMPKKFARIKKQMLLKFDE